MFLHIDQLPTGALMRLYSPFNESLPVSKVALFQLQIAAVGIIPSGPQAEIDANSSVKAGSSTVLAALGAQARVLTKVPVVRDVAGLSSTASAAAPPTVHFDRLSLNGSDTVSLSAGALGSAVVQVPPLELNAPAVQASQSPDRRFLPSYEI